MSKPFDPRDPFFKKAKQEGYRARSAYKLLEIASRMRLLRPGMRVLDLGAAPGGWLQVISRAVGPKGRVVGLDIQAIQPLAKPVEVHLRDIFAEDLSAWLLELEPAGFDLISSDMAPKTTGIKGTDEARSLELASRALAIASEHTVAGGSFVAKVFEGGGLEGFVREVRARFGKVKLIRPDATRGRSFEIFVIGTGARPTPPAGE